ncbi:MAG TPA: hypothetical protein VMZ91_01440, partial [Candidatus Paceibacterota bacterium]|nr:hypothetical protein [Candidatus Paceibacterota bacterium]
EVKKQIDELVNTINEYDNRLVLHKVELDKDGNEVKKRHYTLDGVVDSVARSVTEKTKAESKKKFGDKKRTPEQKIVDDQKKDIGSAIHKFIQDYIINNLIDKDGYIKEKFGDVAISTTLQNKITMPIKNHIEKVLRSYPPGTRFLIEKKVVNTKVKGKVASAIDFLAIFPHENEKTGKQEMKVDVFDWKSTSINLEKDKDVPWYKKEEWMPQMGEYTKILYNYGVKRNELRYTRMIPLVLDYNIKRKNIFSKNKAVDVIPDAISIGNIDPKQEPSLYLLPVPLITESTENEEADKLVRALHAYHQKMWKRWAPEEQKRTKIEQLGKISEGIRNLQIKLNFAPLVNIGNTFIKNANDAIDTFSEKFKNVEQLSENEILQEIKALREYKKSSDIFSSMDEVFLDVYDRKNLSPENKKTLKNLESINVNIKRTQKTISEIYREYTMYLGVKHNVVSETSKKSILEAEIPVKGLEKYAQEASKLPIKIVQLITILISEVGSFVQQKTAEQIKEYGDILLPLEKLAKSRGKNAFNMIGTINESGLYLIKKLSKEFFEKRAKATDEENAFFFLKNMDKNKFAKLKNDYIDRHIEELNNVYSEINEEETRDLKILNLKKSIDIFRDDFNGFRDYDFKRLFMESLIEEPHYSKEYVDMSKDKEALDVWTFFMNLNQKGKELGYLEGKSTNFFPLIEATMLQKLSENTSLEETKDILRGLGTVRINEEQAFARIDPETGKPKQVIPKYFTHKGDRAVKQLSTDLNKVGALWIRALLQYEESSRIEDTLEILLDVEKNKGSLIMVGDKVAFENGNPKVNERENANYEISKTIVDDTLYHIQQDLSSFGNIAISKFSGIVSKTEEGEQALAV